MNKYLSSPWPLLFWFAFYALMGFYFMPSAMERMLPFLQGQSIPDLEAGYTYEHIMGLMDLMGLDGRETYRSIILVEDLIYPIVYAMLMATGTGYFLTRTFPTIRLLWLLSIFPFFAMIADYIENFSMVYIIANYPEVSPKIIDLASSATTIKWGFVFLSLLVLAAALLAHLFMRYVLMRKKTRNSE